MSKKSKKQSRKTSGQRRTTSQPRSSSVSPLEASSSNNSRSPAFESGSRSGSGRTFETDFNPDYSQTIKDLRRIGTLAGVFFLVLIGLTFFLR
jgi:hypothetical protein